MDSKANDSNDKKDLESEFIKNIKDLPWGTILFLIGIYTLVVFLLPYFCL
jgi:hypothetical protein